MSYQSYHISSESEHLLLTDLKEDTSAQVEISVVVSELIHF